MTPTQGGSPDGPALPKPDTQPPGDPHPLPLPAQIRCDPCRGVLPTPDDDGRVQLTACTRHTGVLNRAANVTAGLDPDQEERDYGHLPGASPALAALLPADGLHTHMTLRDVTALTAARIVDASL